MVNKRGYFVNTVDDVYGVAVVATTAREAKKLAWHADEFADADWVNLKVTWMRKAKVEDLPIGLITDDKLALIRGCLSFLEGVECDICHGEDILKAHNGKAVCSGCAAVMNVS